MCGARHGDLPRRDLGHGAARRAFCVRARRRLKRVRFDLVIRGGELVDPGGRSGRLDVAITRGRVAAVDRDIPADSARELVDASGLYVTPGLIDLHTHVYRGVTWWGIDPDPVAWRTGVTTWLDAGSAGAFSLVGLRELVAAPAAARVYALLNVSAVGLVAETGELADLDHCDPLLCERVIDANRDLVLGVKARIDRHTVGRNGLEPLRRARSVADATELPLMVHIAQGPPAVEDVVELLRPGDILTHCATGQSMRVVDARGRPFDFLRRAREDGLVLDVGHGAGSFSWASAAALVEAGLGPDVISSDIHALSRHGPMFDLPTCLSKLLALGVSLADAIAAATVRPAEVLGLSPELGTLRPGSAADVALFALERGRFTLYDVTLEARECDALLRNTLTLRAGRRLEPKAPEPAPPWIELTDAQLALHEDSRASVSALPPAAALDRREAFTPAPVDVDEPAPSVVPERG